MVRQSGTISIIKRAFTLRRGLRNSVVNVLQQEWNAEENGKNIDVRGKMGQVACAVPMDSKIQIQMIIDGMSKGLGYMGTYRLLNKYQLSQGMEAVAPSTVFLTVLNLQPNVHRTTKQK
jgi:hypothetical protein